MSEWKTWSLGGTPEEPAGRAGGPSDGAAGAGSGRGSTDEGGSVESAPTAGAAAAAEAATGAAAAGTGAGTGATQGATPVQRPGDEDQLRWGTEVSPLDLDRLEHVMAEDGFPLARSEFALTTSVDDTSMRIHREPADSPWMQVETRVPLPETTVAALESNGISPFDLQQVANTWNSSHLQPTVFPGRLDEQWYFFLVSRFFVGAGMSDRQIHLLVRRAVVVALQAANEVPGMLPPPSTDADPE